MIGRPRPRTPVSPVDYLDAIRSRVPDSDRPAFDEEVGAVMVEHGVHVETMHAHPIVEVIAELVVYRIMFERLLTQVEATAGRAEAAARNAEFFYDRVDDLGFKFDQRIKATLRQIVEQRHETSRAVSLLFEKERGSLAGIKASLSQINSRVWPFGVHATFLGASIICTLIGIAIDRCFLR